MTHSPNPPADGTVIATRPHMPGYGILPEDEGDGLLPFVWADERLTGSHCYWVATTRPDGRPSLTPVWAVWLDGALWFSSGARSRKARNLAANAAVVIATDDPDEPAIAEGRAALVDTGDPRFDAFSVAYQTKYDTDVVAMGEPVYRMRPEKVIGIEERSFVGSATRWLLDP